MLPDFDCQDCRGDCLDTFRHCLNSFCFFQLSIKTLIAQPVLCYVARTKPLARMLISWSDLCWNRALDYAYIIIESTNSMISYVVTHTMPMTVD